MRQFILVISMFSFINTVWGQDLAPTLYVTGTVLSDEKMLVSVLGIKNIEGNLVTAELNERKVTSRTDRKGYAQLDFSKIASGIEGNTIVVIKAFDRNGDLLTQSNTTVHLGTPNPYVRPEVTPLPSNFPKGKVITITGKNIGADAQLKVGDSYQETLAASDKEMITTIPLKTGSQTAIIVTPVGVSKGQTINVYSLDFVLRKNSINPKEIVQAKVNYESIPVGTKLIFTNKSPETISMTIPGAQNAANECVYTVAEKNGSIPVNITGILRGDFKIALNPEFK